MFCLLKKKKKIKKKKKKFFFCKFHAKRAFDVFRLIRNNNDPIIIVTTLTSLQYFKNAKADFEKRVYLLYFRERRLQGRNQLDRAARVLHVDAVQ